MPVDGHWTIDAVEVPMPLDTLIKVGMLADVIGHGLDLPIKGISLTLCPRRDPAAEGTELAPGIEAVDGLKATAIEVEGIEAALLPYAVFGLGDAGWCYGKQVTAVRESNG